MRRPTRLKLRDGGIAFIDEPYAKVAGIVNRAREKGQDVVKIDGRVYAVARISDVLAPEQAEAAA